MAVKPGVKPLSWSENITVNGSFTSVGIDGITAGSKVDVYNLSGIKVAGDITLDELKSRYEKGIYIINGRKYRVD